MRYTTIHIHITNTKNKTKMKRFFTLSRFVSLVAVAVVMLLAGQSARAAVKITALSGTGGTGGEGYPSLVDGNPATKMGHSFQKDNSDPSWIIMKTSQPIVPTDYFLIIGNDTQQNPNRNWQDWTISAANFDSDAEAVMDADWTVIDERVGEVLPAVNRAGVDFKFNKADGTTAYSYFMIKITAAVNNAKDVWLQMSEFGFGSSEVFLNSAPLGYSILGGSRWNSDGESLNKLFDGNNNTKWGNGFEASADYGKDGKGAYAIFKTTRPIAPTYYMLVTGTDSQAYTGRNWKQYRIYGMTATDDSQATREAEGWELIDDKNVGSDVLPDKNSYTVYLTPSEGNETKYSYFKIEIASLNGAGYMQMSEFALGDAAQLGNDRESIYQAHVSAVDVNKTFYKPLKDQYTDNLEALNVADNIQDVQKYNEVLTSLEDSIATSITAYEGYASIVSSLKNHYDNHSCITGEGRTIIGAYLNDNIAPNSTYPNGSYAYIMANAQLDLEGINQEGLYANALLEQYASDLTSGAITCGYHGINGTETNTNESFGNLFTPDTDAKWCTTNNAQVFVVFAADEPIAPTFYKLTTGGDTGGNPGRNWKNWKIYGANFDSDEAADRDAEGWVLLDEKTNIGTSQLPAANKADAYFLLSQPSATPYRYFKIEVEALANGTTQQMSRFEFGNDANRILFRNEQYEAHADFNTDVVAYKPFIDSYTSNLAALKNSASIVEVSSLLSTLDNLQSQIEESVNLYHAYDSVAEVLMDVSGNYSDYAQVAAWVNAYCNDKVAPGVQFRNGTYAYIMENRQLDSSDKGIKAETIYLSSLVAASESFETTRFIVLDGQGKWNDNENWAKLLDDDLSTKWGCNYNTTNPPYVIFRTLEPVNPYFYYLYTGGDTERYTGRNWGTWKIYAANFEGDGEATRDADGWVLVDEKTNVGQNRLHPTNNTESYFGFSSETTTPYTYYMLVMEKSYSGDQQQMQELHFGTAEEFDAIKETYKSQANDFNTDIICEQRLLNEYAEAIEGIDDIVNMEVLFRAYDAIVNLQDSINASAASYANYMDAAQALGQFLDENPGVKGDMRDKIETYLADDAVEPSDDFYPNGSYSYIIDERLLGDSALLAEIAFLDSMKREFVAEGYIAGTEITSLVNDPSLAKGGEGWSTTSYTHGTYNGMSAGEFCEGKRVFDINQTLTGLKDGYYEVRVNAAFRSAGDTTSTDYRAILYANDTKMFAPAVRDEMVLAADAKDGENCHISGSIPDKAITNEQSGDTIGYVIWGVQGSCIAFNAGRYENVLVAKVTDGKLTFGMKNDGTPDKTNGKGDWSILGNTRIFYLGAEESDEVSAAFDRALACQSKRAAVLTAEKEYDIATFRHLPNFSQAQKNALTEAAAAAETATTVAAKEELQNTFSALCEPINATKDVYVNAMDAASNVYEKWINNAALADTKPLEADVYDLQDALLGGAYTADEAVAAKAAIYTKWPDYLEVTNALDMGYVEDEPFSYIISAANSRPYVLANGIYEKLDSTKTVLKFEYKSEEALTGSRFYFGTPTPTPTQTLEADGFAAQDDWTTVYFYIAPALQQWSFGDLDDVLRFDLGSSVTEGATIYLRHMQYITEEQAKAEGGQTTYPTAIGTVDEKTAPAVQGIFNLAGQRVNRAEKGIYIINGRKVLR